VVHGFSRRDDRVPDLGRGDGAPPGQHGLVDPLHQVPQGWDLDLAGALPLLELGFPEESEKFFTLA
jgi:hypothetical protein